jgi:quercetin dioxygenase-like cupin family protein
MSAARPIERSSHPLLADSSDMGPILVEPDGGEAISDRAERTTLILVGREELTLCWFRYERGESGPDPHVHRRHSDAFYVLDGELTFELGPDREVKRGGPGTVVIAPPNVVHTFRNESPATARFLNVHAPGCGFDDHMRAMRDGRDETEPFDQFDPPADGGRPLSDAHVGQRRASHDGLTIAEATILSGEHYELPAQPRTTSFWVLEDELTVLAGGESVTGELGACIHVGPGQAHALEGPARAVAVSA